jgi:nucleotide-binding universal stress UspA family protein
MPASLLVPLDGSLHAEQALPLAAELARRNDGHLLLAIVRSSLPLDVDPTPVHAYLEGVAARMEAELPGRIGHEVLVDELGPLAYRPPASNLMATLLARHASAKRIQLIVMTTHGRGGIRRAWLGSVADSLIRLAPCPVLLVRPSDDAGSAAPRTTQPVRHILVPLDGSEDAARVLPFATAIGSTFDASYTLLRVVSPLAWDPVGDIYAAYPAETPELNREVAAAELEAAAAPLREAGADVSTEVMLDVSPAPAILDFADARHVDLIALSTSGAGRARRMLLGSVADKLIRGADVPVLVCNVRRPGGRKSGRPAAEPEREPMER